MIRRPPCSTLFPTRRSSDLVCKNDVVIRQEKLDAAFLEPLDGLGDGPSKQPLVDRLRERLEERSEEHTSELQSLTNLVCRLLLEKKKQTRTIHKQPSEHGRI